MSILELETTEGLSLELDIAGAGSRLLAGLVDLCFLILVFMSVLLTLAIMRQRDPTGVSDFLVGFVLLSSLLLFVAYHTLLPHFWGGRTLGKALVGLRVVDMSGSPATAVAQALRSMLWMIEILPIPLPPGLLVMAGSAKCQRLGDMVAGTLVVRTPRTQIQSEPWSRETWSALEKRRLGLSAAFAQRFEREDLVFLRRVITRRSLDKDVRTALHRRVAEHYLARLGLKPSGDPRVVLKELYLFLREQKTLAG